MGYRGEVNFPWQGKRGRKVLQAVHRGHSVEDAVDELRAEGWQEMTRRKVLRAYHDALPWLGASRNAEINALIEDMHTRLEAMDIARREIDDLTVSVKRRLNRIVS